AVDEGQLARGGAGSLAEVGAIACQVLQAGRARQVSHSWAPSRPARWARGKTPPAAAGPKRAGNPVVIVTGRAADCALGRRWHRSDRRRRARAASLRRPAL